MLKTTSIGDVYGGPAVYAMYGGARPRLWVAYVGVAGKLRQRLGQHFVNRDSSVVTGASATGLNIDHVRQVDWWEDPGWSKQSAREAAELVAFDVFEPALRSRGSIPAAAQKLYARSAFRKQVAEVFEGPPAGRLVLPRLDEVAAEVTALQERIELLEEQLRAKTWKR